MKKISVITICFNCKDELERTIRSVLAQDFPGMEFAVIDGGSTDGTKQLLEQYRDQIDIMVSEPDDGIYDAMNKGLRMSSGEWVICMNAGDEFASPDILRRVFSSDIPDDVTFIYSDYKRRDADGTISIHATDRHRGEVFHQSAIYKRQLHQTHGYYTVTHPYIVSDLLFFLSVPERQFMKMPFEISLSDAGGASGGLWCREQALCLRVVYGQETISSAFAKYWISRLKRLIPATLRTKVKRLLGK